MAPLGQQPRGADNREQMTTVGAGEPDSSVTAAHLQVAVDSLSTTLVHSQITLGKTVKEIAVFISRAVLLENFPHFGFKKGHVHIDSHHL